MTDEPRSNAPGLEPDDRPAPPAALKPATPEPAAPKPAKHKPAAPRSAAPKSTPAKTAKPKAVVPKPAQPPKLQAKRETPPPQPKPAKPKAAAPKPTNPKVLEPKPAKPPKLQAKRETPAPQPAVAKPSPLPQLPARVLQRPSQPPAEKPTAAPPKPVVATVPAASPVSQATPAGAALAPAPVATPTIQRAPNSAAKTAAPLELLGRQLARRLQRTEQAMSPWTQQTLRLQRPAPEEAVETSEGGTRGAPDSLPPATNLLGSLAKRVQRQEQQGATGTFGRLAGGVERAERFADRITAHFPAVAAKYEQPAAPEGGAPNQPAPASGPIFTYYPEGSVSSSSSSQPTITAAEVLQRFGATPSAQPAPRPAEPPSPPKPSAPVNLAPRDPRRVRRFSKVEELPPSGEAREEPTAPEPASIQRKLAPARPVSPPPPAPRTVSAPTPPVARRQRSHFEEVSTSAGGEASIQRSPESAAPASQPPPAAPPQPATPDSSGPLRWDHLGNVPPTIQRQLDRVQQRLAEQSGLTPAPSAPDLDRPFHPRMPNPPPARPADAPPAPRSPRATAASEPETPIAFGPDLQPRPASGQRPALSPAGPAAQLPELVQRAPVAPPQPRAPLAPRQPEPEPEPIDFQAEPLEPTPAPPSQQPAIETTAAVNRASATDQKLSETEPGLQPPAAPDFLATPIIAAIQRAPEPRPAVERTADELPLRHSPLANETPAAFPHQPAELEVRSDPLADINSPRAPSAQIERKPAEPLASVLVPASERVPPVPLVWRQPPAEAPDTAQTPGTPASHSADAPEPAAPAAQRSPLPAQSDREARVLRQPPAPPETPPGLEPPPPHASLGGGLPVQRAPEPMPPAAPSTGAEPSQGESAVPAEAFEPPIMAAEPPVWPPAEIQRTVETREPLTLRVPPPMEPVTAPPSEPAPTEIAPGPDLQQAAISNTIRRQTSASDELPLRAPRAPTGPAASVPAEASPPKPPLPLRAAPEPAHASQATSAAEPTPARGTPRPSQSPAIQRQADTSAAPSRARDLPLRAPPTPIEPRPVAPQAIQTKLATAQPQLTLGSQVYARGVKDAQMPVVGPLATNVRGNIQRRPAASGRPQAPPWAAAEAAPILGLARSGSANTPVLPQARVQREATDNAPETLALTWPGSQANPPVGTLPLAPPGPAPDNSARTATRPETQTNNQIAPKPGGAGMAVTAVQNLPLAPVIAREDGNTSTALTTTDNSENDDRLSTLLAGLEDEVDSLADDEDYDPMQDIDLDQLANQLVPYIKRLLAVERERHEPL